MTQRGNRRLATFFGVTDYELYKEILARESSRAGVEIWAYCLLPNHVHLIATPPGEGSLAEALGRAHRAYTVIINRRQGWRGCLWQGRFASFPMDEAHLYAAARYVLLNPARAGLVTSILDWPHSSLQAHLTGKSDGLTRTDRLAFRVSSWQDLLADGLSLNEREQIRRHASNGMPLGSDLFVAGLEQRTGRRLREPVLSGGVPSATQVGAASP